MMRGKRDWERWLIVVVFAIGMAWVEAACVYYLRVMTGRVNPYQTNPLPLEGVIGSVELAREAATMIMLLMVGALAARAWHRRLAYALVAFGVWDIFYYVFLRVIADWPTSPFDWDVLFLLPLPWWGPVLAPMCIALLMIVWGTLETQYARSTPGTTVARTVWTACALGIALALYAFMEDAIRTIPHGLEATRSVLPKSFNWMLFGAALTLMAAPVVHAALRAFAWRGALEP